MSPTHPKFSIRARSFLKRFASNPIRTTSKFINNRLGTPFANLVSQSPNLEKYSDLEIDDIIEMLFRHEKKRQQAPLEVGYILQDYLLSNPTLTAIKPVTHFTSEKYSKSVFGLFLCAISSVKTGHYDFARDLVEKRIIENRLPSNIAREGVIRSRKRGIRFLKINWMVEFLGIQTMHHVSETPALNIGRVPSIIDFNNIFKGFGRLHLQSTLFSREPIIEEKSTTYYLDMGREVFEQSTSLTEELTTISTILRGRSHQFKADQSEIDLARELYSSIRHKWIHLLGPLDKGGANQSSNPIKTVSVLARVLKLAELLNEQRDIELIGAAMMAIGSADWGNSTKWYIARTLLETSSKTYLHVLDDLVSRKPLRPETKENLYHFMVWALIRGSYNLGMLAYEQYPQSLKHHECSLLYSELLWRVGRFEAARNVKITYNSAALSRPHNFCPAIVWSTLCQIETLAALDETNQRYLSVPQPANPIGVILLADAAHEVDVKEINTWKNKGWIVVSLMEGVLSKQKTGIDELDRIQCCLTRSNQMVLSKASVFSEPIDNVEMSIDSGKLSWRGLEFSDVLRAHVASVQRSFHVDFSDSAVETDLSDIRNSVSTAAQIVTYVHKTTREVNLNAIILTGSNDSIPALVYSRYANTFADPDNFVCVQNKTLEDSRISPAKFAKLAPYLSAATEATAQSLEDFEVYLENNIHRAESLKGEAMQILGLSVGECTNIQLHQNAKLALARIQGWKANGGKVACMFGNLVYHREHFFRKGAVHKDFKTWINHTVDQVRGSQTLLLIKPHPLEVKADGMIRVGEQLKDLIMAPLPDNVILLGYDWFEPEDLAGFVDLGLIYANTHMGLTAGVLNIPCVDGSQSWVQDYPVGHVQSRSLRSYSKYVRFEKVVKSAANVSARTVMWLDYMGYLAPKKQSTPIVENENN